MTDAAIHFANPVTIQSVAGVLTLTEASNSFIATGSEALTSITGWTSGIAMIRWNTARTLTHNAASLILQNGASRTTAAGDVGYYELTATSARETGYFPAEGIASLSNLGGVKLGAGLAIDTDGVLSVADDGLIASFTAIPQREHMTCALGAGLDNPCGFAYGGGQYFYVASNTTPAVLAKVDKDTMQQVSSMTLTGTTETRTGALIAVSDTLIVHASYTNPALFTFINGATMSIVGTLTGIEETVNDKFIRGMTYDGNYVYACCDASNGGKVIKIDPVNRTRVEAITFLEDSAANCAYDIVALKGYLYVALASTPGKVIRVLANPALSYNYQTDILTLPTGSDNCQAICSDGQYLYVGCYTNPLKVYKIDPATLAVAASYTAASGLEGCYGIATDGNYVYVSNWEDPAHLLYLRCNDLSLVKDVPIAPGFCANWTYVKPFWYCGNDVSEPGQVSRMTLAMGGVPGPQGAPGPQGPQGPQGGLFGTCKLTADQTAINSTAATNVNGLSFAVTGGTSYYFEYDVVYQASNTGCGAKFTVAVPGATVFAAKAQIMGTAAAGTGGEYQGPIAASGSLVGGSAVQAANTNYLAKVSGILVPSANGTLQLQMASSSGSYNVTPKRGSCGRLFTM